MLRLPPAVLASATHGDSAAISVNEERRRGGVDRQAEAG
jgi:hypothetical protein